MYAVGMGIIIGYGYNNRVWHVGMGIIIGYGACRYGYNNRVWGM